MPELPDVEGFRRILSKAGLKKRIARVSVSDPRILGDLSPAALGRRLEGARLTEARRHGKHLLARIDKGGWLELHFGMTGALHALRGTEDAPRFTRVRLDFESDGGLAYSNKRMLGRVGLVEDAEDFIAEERLGPDALDERLGLPAFKAALAATRRDIKAALMDQSLIAGIGNIFADEILFRARLRPTRQADRLDAAELGALYKAMRTALAEAIEIGAGAEDFAGRLPRGWLIPERKKGGRCPRCGRPLQIAKAAGRTGYYCGHCQR